MSLPPTINSTSIVLLVSFYQNHDDDRTERYPYRHLIYISEYHHRPDEDEHEAEPVLQVLKVVDQVGEGEDEQEYELVSRLTLFRASTLRDVKECGHRPNVEIEFKSPRRPRAARMVPRAKRPRLT